MSPRLGCIFVPIRIANRRITEKPALTSARVLSARWSNSSVLGNAAFAEADRRRGHGPRVSHPLLEASPWEAAERKGGKMSAMLFRSAAKQNPGFPKIPRITGLIIRPE